MATTAEICVVCGEYVYHEGKVHVPCYTLLQRWGGDVDEIKREFIKADILALRMTPVLRSVATRAALQAALFVVLGSIICGVLYALVSSSH